MRSFTGIPGAEKLEARMEQNKLTRLLTNHVSLAFCYGIFLFLYEISLLRNLISPLHPVLMAWAGLLFVYDVLVRQLWKKAPYWPALLVFIVLSGVTALVNREAGLVTCIKSMVMMIVPLCAFYPVCLMAPRETRKRAMLISLLGAAVVLFLASLVAVVMYLAQYSEYLTFMGITKITGIRYYAHNDPSTGIILKGGYEDPNHAAAFAVIIAVYCLVLYTQCRKGFFAKPWQNKLCRIFCIANVAVQAVFFPLANSRGGWLCLGVALFMTAGLWLYNVRLKADKNSKRALQAVALAALAVALVIGGLLVLRTATTKASELLKTGFNFTIGPSHGGDPEHPGEEEEAPIPDSFEKTEFDLGSGRIIIWKESLDLFLKKPVLGDAAQHQYYAAKYEIGPRFLSKGAAVHNSYLDLAMANGIMGFVPMMAFWVLCLIYVLKKMFREKERLEGSYYAATFMVLMMAGVSFFLSCVFVNTTAAYFLMLVPTGYLVAGAAEKEEDHEGT